MNLKTCLSPGSTRIGIDNRREKLFYLASSWRISFIFILQNDISHSWEEIFKISGHTDTGHYQRYPSLWFNPDKELSIMSSSCYQKVGDKEIHIKYPNNLVKNQPSAITIEYNRNHNQIKLYVDSIELNPYRIDGHAESNLMCYGKRAVLYLAWYKQAASANVENFEYEENLTDNFLGGLSVDEIKNNSCSV